MVQSSLNVIPQLHVTPQNVHYSQLVFPASAQYDVFMKTTLIAILSLLISTALAGDWPQLHGPNRDNMSTETGLLKTLPEGGPELIWKYSKCGKGYSMVSIADNKIFLTGDFDSEEKVIALDMDGKLLWETVNGASWTGAYPGSRTVPTYDDGFVLQMNPTGRFASFDANTGKERWAVDVHKKFKGRYGIWAMSESIAVDGDLAFCMPGGPEALVVAVNKKTGETVWVNGDLDEVATYTSPIIVTYKGIRQLIALAQKSVISVDVKTGKLLWSHPHPTRYNQAVNSPMFKDGYVFVTSGHGGGARLLKIKPDQSGVDELWHNGVFDNCHGDVLLVGDHLYGSTCRQKKTGFVCADFLTGKIVQNDPKFRKTSMTYADGMLYCISDKGLLAFVEPLAAGFKIAGTAQLPMENRQLYLTHPVICDGKMYLRYWQNLYVYKLSK